MNKIKFHETAIAILEAINLAERIRSTRLENLETARKWCYPVYFRHCKELIELSDQVIARLESRYAKHLKKLEK